MAFNPKYIHLSHRSPLLRSKQLTDPRSSQLPFATPNPYHQPPPGTYNQPPHGSTRPNALTTPVPFDMQHLPVPNAHLLAQVTRTTCPRHITIQQCLTTLRENLIQLNEALAVFGGIKIALFNPSTNDTKHIATRRQGEDALEAGRAAEADIWRKWYWIHLHIQEFQVVKEAGGDEAQLVIECLAQKTMLGWYAADVTLIQGMVAKLPLCYYAPRA